MSEATQVIADSLVHWNGIRKVGFLLNERRRTVKRTVLFMLSILPVFTLIAQEAKKVQEPEYIGVVFFLDPGGTLTPLERQESNAAFKVKAMGFGGGRGSIVYKGGKSPVRFKVGQELQFVVRLHVPAGIEPDGFVNLDVLKASKNERSITTMKVGAMGIGGAKSQKGEALRALNFSKYGEDSLKVSPVQPLEAGEYVITSRGGRGSFLFGIDKK